MSSYDFSLPISFSLATEVGLEEAVLMSFFQQAAFVSGQATQVYSFTRLVSQLPFWTGPMVLRLLASLQTSGKLQFEKRGNDLNVHLLEDNENGHESSVGRVATPAPQASQTDPLLDRLGQLQRHASATEDKNVFRRPEGSPPAPERRREVAQSQPPAAVSATEKRRGMSDFDLYLEQKERTRQPDQWQPEEATLEQIAQAGIARPFAVQLLPEFLLRIREQRKNVRTWNSEFFKYVKRQWQYQQSDRASQHEGTSSSSHSSRASKEQVRNALNNIHDTDW